MPQEKTRDLKKEILLVAQEMFLQHGYDKTTFQMIADALGITKGAITYHFKNKHLIMAHFIDQYFLTLRQFISSFPGEFQNLYWYYCVMYIYAYRQILRTQRTQDLFYHKDQMSQWQTGKVETVYNIYKRIHEDFHKTCTHEELLMKTYMDLGARKRLYEEFSADPGLVSVDSFCYYHVYMLGAFSKLDEFTIRENIRLAFQFCDRHVPPVTPLLGG